MSQRYDGLPARTTPEPGEAEHRRRPRASPDEGEAGHTQRALVEAPAWTAMKEGRALDRQAAAHRRIGFMSRLT
jgi:hypothetical protein